MMSDSRCIAEVLLDTKFVYKLSAIKAISKLWAVVMKAARHIG
jgi:hypothetical protein